MKRARFENYLPGLQPKGTHVIVRSKAGGWIGWSRIDVVYVNADCQLGEVVLEAFGNLTVCTRDQFNNRGYELPGGGIFK